MTESARRLWRRRCPLRVEEPEHVHLTRGNRRRRFALLWLALLIVVEPLAATTVLPVDFAQMVAASQVIVHARVVAVEGELVGSRRTIESRVTVAVVSPLKGQPGPVVVFRVPGGRVGRYRRIFVGAPTFNPGDEVLLFLKGQVPAMPMPYGLSQGVYRISRVTGSPLVMPVPAIDGVAGTVRGDPARTPLSLDDFRRQVRTLAGTGR
jgi:hypothetical protein